MLKRILSSAVIIVALSSVVSCKPDQSILPSATRGAVPLATDTRAVKSSSTQASETLITPALCFTPIDFIPIAFMPGNTKLALRSSSGVQIFNLESMKEEGFIQAPKAIVSAALSPDGQILAWSFEDHTIQLIQVSDGKLINTLKGHTDIVFKLRFTPSGDKLFSGSHDGSVRVWDDKGNPLQIIETGGEVLGIGVSPDRARLATIPFDGPVALWDLNVNNKIANLGGTGGYDTSDAVFSPDGKYLAADLATGLFLWRISDGQSMWNQVKNSMAIIFSPDGRFLAYSNVDDNNKVILSSPDGTQIIRTLEGMQGPVWELIFSLDSSMLAATDGSEIRIWKVNDGNLLYDGKSACP